ncbi:malto-oligosyltrehalose trehalohydrolase [Sphingomonas crocodyli]|uniref:Malto-oligosyltrehalose trehalohydrolase n=1 Tax=Sphingomonas crocodyli TaxID=1979270 RepID=A0A437LYH1_9SPHN|nr:malto-oligosyltrehalose trehalohydrolase [Sphingomonas crocodyli]RVT90396.1 malto-oligosyltrehalose trehalohydrolase [Sphingomonas crocodyli]
MTRWGPHRLTAERWRFALWAPSQKVPSLEVEGASPLAMAPQGDGFFHVDAPARPGSRYRFRLDDGRAVPDPASRAQSGGVHGWSVVVDHAYGWQTPGWLGRPWEEAIIQEVHAGVLGGFGGVARELERLAALGITAIELMPVGAFPGTRNWGYDGVLPFAPAEAYGSPDELKALIDTAHSLRLMVFIDVVYNHFGPDGNYLEAFAPDFFHAEAKTPWGGAVAVDEPAVAAYFRENALMWLHDYRVDGLRFDAVHAIGNPMFLNGLARDLRETVGKDRHVHLVLENEANDAAHLGAGRFDAQWNDDVHNILHVLLTGETSAYYRDFADRREHRLARALSEGFIYQGEVSVNQDGKRRGTASGHLPPSAFVGFLQNHDQIGNRALGERLTVLCDMDRLRAATALLFLSPQIPLIFMGDEVGSQTPFLFFTDFHDQLADAVREGRRREFAKFSAFSDETARARIPDPNDPATFAASRPLPGPDAATWEALYRSLIDIRATWLVPRLRGTTSMGAEPIGDMAVAAAWRMGDGRQLRLAIDLAKVPAGLPDMPGKDIFREGERFVARLDHT